SRAVALYVLIRSEIDACQAYLTGFVRWRIQFNLSMCKINRQEIWPLRPNSLLFKRVPASLRVSSSRYKKIRNYCVILGEHPAYLFEEIFHADGLTLIA